MGQQQVRPSQFGAIRPLQFGGHMGDPFALDRFVEAQQPVYAAALREIAKGAKRGHWMWFVFPQVAGLGSSMMAERYAIHSLEEARAYLVHPVLGARYRECVEALQDLPFNHAETVFGPVDTEKLRSSLTLFAAAGGPPLLNAAIERWFGGRRDEATLMRLEVCEQSAAA